MRAAFPSTAAPLLAHYEAEGRGTGTVILGLSVEPEIPCEPSPRLGKDDEIPRGWVQEKEEKGVRLDLNLVP